MSVTTEAKTLLQFLLDLLTDDDAREAFGDDPRKALDEAGLHDVTLEEIKELLPVVLDRVSPETCADYEDECEDYDGPCPPAHCPPELSDCDDRPCDDHDLEIAKVVTHLNYVCNNYSFDSHDTIFNNNVNIVNLGDGDIDFDQDIDFRPISTGDGGVVVNGPNSAPITTGHGNVVGDGNQVSGDDSNTAFGAGSVTADNDLDDGSALNSGAGAATGQQSDDDTVTEIHGENNNVGSGAQANTQDSGNIDNSLHDSGNIDNSLHDSGNIDNSLHDSGNIDNSDSGNVDLGLGDTPEPALVDDVAP